MHKSLISMKIKILQVLPELNTVGIKLNTVELAKYLIQSGHGAYILFNGCTMLEALGKNITFNKIKLITRFSVFMINCL